MATSTDTELLRGSMEQLLALAASDPFAQLAALVEPHALALEALEAKAAAEAAAHYNDALARFSRHVRLIIQNNPNKSLAEIMARPDVAHMLTSTLAEANRRAESTFKGAWKAGYSTGRLHVRREATVLGLDKPEFPIMDEHEFLDSLLSDLDKNGTATHGRIMAAAAEGFEEGVEVGDGDPNPVVTAARLRAAHVEAKIDKASRNMAHRSRSGAVVAANRSYNEAKLAGYEEMQGSAAELGTSEDGKTLYTIEKVWYTTFGPNTCADCAALHGTVVAIETTFDPAASFGQPQPVYKDLMVPPRHVRCRCCILPQLVGPTPPPDSALSPAAMRQAARDYAGEAPGQTPRTFGGDSLSKLSADTDFVSASDLRRMSDGRVEHALRSFRSCLLGPQ